MMHFILDQIWFVPSVSMVTLPMTMISSFVIVTTMALSDITRSVVFPLFCECRTVLGPVVPVSPIGYTLILVWRMLIMLLQHMLHPLPQ